MLDQQTLNICPPRNAGSFEEWCVPLGVRYDVLGANGRKHELPVAPHTGGVAPGERWSALEESSAKVADLESSLVNEVE
jgi:hypothetical protein